MEKRLSDGIEISLSKKGSYNFKKWFSNEKGEKKYVYISLSVEASGELLAVLTGYFEPIRGRLIGG